MRNRTPLLLFLLSFLTFAWFHQGGGWNQNARFAEVRAIVERGTFAIDDFLVYRADGERFVRETIRNGAFEREGKMHRLCWPGQSGPVPVDGGALLPGDVPVLVGKETASGDIGYAPDGHFHSNKPPGTSLLAVPAYFIAYHIERLAGLDPDHWRVVNVNLWLCTIGTVGWISALGVALFWSVATQMFPGRPKAVLGATLSFAFGTTYFPFATLLFDHNLTAVLLLGSFASVRKDRPALAGGLAGLATITNYLAAIPGVAFGFWALARRKSHALPYLAGVILPAIALLAYNAFALGSPWLLNTSFQNPMFKETAPAFLGMFTLPSWFAAQVITISPWRGLFVLSPVLIFAAAALFRWEEQLRIERRLILGICAFFFLINISFNGFHGGMAAGPRYLIPLLPFLCLALVPAFQRWPRLCSIAAAIGIVQQSLLTITDALNPVGITDHAWQNHPDEWKEKLRGNSLVWRYAWPIFGEGRAWPVIRAEFDEAFPNPNDPSRAPAWERVLAGGVEPVLLAAMPGPVSMNPVGATEGSFFAHSPPHSERAQWAAWNLGEWLLPASRWSVAPLALIWVIGVWRLRRQLTVEASD